MSTSYPGRRVRMTALLASLGLHAVILGSHLFSEAPSVEIQKASSSIEFSLAAMGSAHRTNEEVREAPLFSDDLVSSSTVSHTQPLTDISLFNDLPGALTEAEPVRHTNLPPAYPRSARLAGFEGSVLLGVSVLEDGRVGSVEILESSGYASLDKSARSAVRTWLFQPAHRMGHPVPSVLRLPVIFQLNRNTHREKHFAFRHLF